MKGGREGGREGRREIVRQTEGGFREQEGH